jgi:hypothetical protein
LRFLAAAFLRLGALRFLAAAFRFLAGAFLRFGAAFFFAVAFFATRFFLRAGDLRLAVAIQVSSDVPIRLLINPVIASY